jgi:hypothetical protein
LPVWLIVTLIVAAALIIGAWAEAKLNIIIAELRAIRIDLDKLWSDRTEEEGHSAKKDSSDGLEPQGR